MNYKYLFLILFLTGISITSFQAQSQIYDLDEYYEIPFKGMIELRTNDAEITITGTDRKDVHLVVHREAVARNLLRKGDPGFEFEVSRQDERLRIIERRENNAVIGYYTEKVYVITLEVPQDVNLILQGDDDDYLVQNIAGKIYLNAEDGDAQFENCTGNEFDFIMDDGTLYMEGGRGKLRAEGEDGEFIFEKSDFYILDVRMDDGDLRLVTRFHDKGKYEIYNEDGSIDLKILDGGGEIRIRHSDGIVRASRHFEYLIDEDHETLLELPGGNARMYIRTDDGAIRLGHLVKE